MFRIFELICIVLVNRHRSCPGYRIRAQPPVYPQCFQPIAFFLAEKSYFEAWKYVPFLLLGIVFSSFAGFLGTNYIAAKKTGGVFKTSVIGAIVNIVILLLLVPRIGINGAAIATMVSFFTIWILRVQDTKEYAEIRINWRKLILNLIVIFVQIGVLYLELKLNYILQSILVFLLCLVNNKEIKQIIELIQLIIVKRRKN